MPACALCENVQAAGEACEVCGHPFPADRRIPLPIEPLEELEATGVGPVEVVVSAMEDLQPTALEGLPTGEADESEPTALCRYCRNPAPAGEAFCVHCGMRLPALPGGAEPPPVRVTPCRDCGTPVKGTSCPGCGARVQG